MIIPTPPPPPVNLMFDLVDSICTVQNLTKYHLNALELPHGIPTEVIALNAMDFQVLVITASVLA